MEAAVKVEGKVGKQGKKERKGTGLWAQAEIPHKGWTCLGVDDVVGDDDSGSMERCEMCQANEIRYAHIMTHPDYGTVRAGCVCAANMSGDYAGQDAMERKLKNRRRRRARWIKRRWKPVIDGFILNANRHKFRMELATGLPVRWTAVVDGEKLAQQYETLNAVKLAAFDHVWGATA